MPCLGVGIRACYKTAPFKTIKYIYQNTCFVTDLVRTKTR